MLKFILPHIAAFNKHCTHNLAFIRLWTTIYIHIEVNAFWCFPCFFFFKKKINGRRLGFLVMGFEMLTQFIELMFYSIHLW